MPISKKKDTRDQLIEEFKKCLEQDQLPWRSGWVNNKNYNFTTDKPYRGVNQMMLMLVAYANGYKDPRWMTYKQAQNKGMQVKSGSKGVQLEKWNWYDTKRKVNVSDKRRYMNDHPEVREEDLRPYSRGFYVFNGSQIQGMPEMEKVGDWELSDCSAFVDNLQEKLGIAYEEVGNQAFYTPSEDKVVLPPRESFLTEYDYLSTKLHEFSHSCCSENRLGYRDEIEGDVEDQYAKEELMVELASCFLCQDIGISMRDRDLDNHKAYIQSWISMLDQKPDVLFESIKKATRIEEYECEVGEYEKYFTAEVEEEKKQKQERQEEEIER